jgi:hypothetical protein
MIKYPHIAMAYRPGDNGLAFLGKCQNAARAAGLSESAIRLFFIEALDSGDFLAVAKRWFSIKEG